MSQKIMVVDDEPDIRESLRMLLEQTGHEVMVADGAMECLGKIADFMPDLLISDFFMPNISGRQMIEDIRKDPRYDSIKIIFLTVAEFQGAEFEKEMESLGISAYVQKPIDTNDFLKTVNSLLGGTG